jgi:hypothetical protein
MIRSTPPVLSLALLLTLLVGIPTEAAESAAVAREGDREGIAFFEQKVLPVLKRHCYECHSRDSEEAKGGLRVDTREAIRAGGATGEGIVPGDAEASLVIQAVRYIEDAYEMPPSGKLSDDVIRDLEHWVRIGAPDPREEPAEVRDPATTPLRPE